MGTHKLKKMSDGTTTQVKQQDMNKEMLDFAINTAAAAIEKITQKEQEAAEEIKAAMDKRFHPSWQCIVGRGYKAAVTHETKHFAYFYVGALAVLIFRTADNTPLPIGI